MFGLVVSFELWPYYDIVFRKANVRGVLSAWFVQKCRPRAVAAEAVAKTRLATFVEFSGGASRIEHINRTNQNTNR